MSNKNKVANLVHTLMIASDNTAVSQTSLKVMKAIKDEDVENQILGVAALLLTLIDKYELNYIDVLGMADHKVFSGEYNNLHPDYKLLTQLMKDKYELI